MLQTKKKKESIATLSLNGASFENKRIIVDIAVDFFAEIGSKLANRIEQRDGDCPNQFNTLPRSPNSVLMRPATVDEVKRIIKNFDNNKAAGIDGIGLSERAYNITSS